MTTYYEQDINGCLTAAIGDNGLSDPELSEAHDAAALPFLRLPALTDDLGDCQMIVDCLKEGSDDIVILGVGGSSLGAQTLAQLTGFGTPGFRWDAGAPRVHFLDNLDGHTMTRLAVSKSGSTAETMMQVYAAATAMKEAGMGEGAWKQFAAIVTPGNNPLRNLAEGKGLPVIEHNPAIGGRFTVLSNVGMVPAMIMGLDPKRIRAGAASVMETVLDGRPAREVAPALGAATVIGLEKDKAKNISVLMPYTDRLHLFAYWYRQLWGESLGKEGNGSTPMNALGPVDQHSQLQIYLDGPDDKFHTVMMTKCAGTGPLVDGNIVDDARVVYLENKCIGDLVDAEQRATADTLINNKKPTRIMRIDDVTEESMGALLMHYMLETVISGHLLGIDPFDQPAVEEGKILARRYLGEM